MLLPIVRCMFMLLCPVLSFNYVFEPCCAWIFDQCPTRGCWNVMVSLCFCDMLWHGFVTNVWFWSFCFCPTRGCWCFCGIIGTGIFYVFSATCVVCQAIPAIVLVHVHVVKSCLLCKSEFV